MNYGDLEKRETFHLTFLRILLRKVPPSGLVLKGGSNLRFFFRSPRFSEDVDVDVQKIEVHTLRDAVMSVLESSALGESMRTYGVERIMPPGLATAKQTETVQRFKVHLISTAGEDLFTKVEFSRRGVTEEFRSEGVESGVLARYRMPPLVIPHYTALSTLVQKLRAMRGRQQPQARDVFDLYLLKPHEEVLQFEPHATFSSEELSEIKSRIYAISFEEFRDKVVAFLGPDEMPMYDSSSMWDEMRLATVSLLE